MPSPSAVEKDITAETVLTIDQPCACSYPKATVWDLCVLLFAREYQGTILKANQNSLMKSCESIVISLPLSIKSKMPLYTLPMISPPPEIIMKPFPEIELIKEWMHEYDFYLNEMVEEIGRVQKRLIELRKKAGIKTENPSTSLTERDENGIALDKDLRDWEEDSKKIKVKCTYKSKKQRLNIDTIKQLTASFNSKSESNDQTSIKDGLEKKNNNKIERKLKHKIEEDCHCCCHDSSDNFLEWMVSQNPPTYHGQPIPTKLIESFMGMDLPNNPKGIPVPSKEEWRMMVDEFVKDFPDQQSKQVHSSTPKRKVQSPTVKNKSTPSSPKSNKKKVNHNKVGSSGMTKEEKEILEHNIVLR